MEYLTVDEVAARLRVAPKTVRRWCASGQLKASRAGRPWRIKPADLEAFMQVQSEVKKELKKADGLAGFPTRPTFAAVL
jgi:excisionase family DNA binding protein